MNKSFLFLTILIVLVTGCSSSQSKKSGKPVLTLESDIVNIGKIPVGDSTNVELIVKNTGSDTLKISGLGYSCGCTDGEIQNSSIAPNDSGMISLKYKNSEDLDAIEKTIIIENNSEIPFKAVNIRGSAYK